MDKPAQWALVGAAWFLALSVAVFGFLAWQRAGQGVSQGAASAVGWGPQPDGTALCPVTGQRVKVAPDTPQVVYLGHTYYFSQDRDAQGKDARTRFLMDPNAWLQHPGSTP